MDPRELKQLLGMVENLNSELDKYLAESSLPAEAIPHILKFCQHMRAKNLDSAIQYWLGAIERHATEISNPQTPSEEIGSLPSSARLLSTELHLLKDVHNLHILLTHSRGAIH
jgi:hypothetical protein